MNLSPITLLIIIVQFTLFLLFVFFALFNYLYGIAGLFKPKIAKSEKISDVRVAVVIASYNEDHVLQNTLQACNELTYKNKLIILADDSTDAKIVEKVRQLAIDRGCKKVDYYNYFEKVEIEGSMKDMPIEVWESEGFTLFHRPNNAGFKGGSLRKIQQYLKDINIDYMYLLDADWHPQKDTLERTLEVIEADSKIAFVQTKRITNPDGINLFQKYVSISEEGCYYIDFEGRQVLNHPILFSGCCTLFRMSSVEEVGGFPYGHLTEDLDLTDRLWLNGKRGIYLSGVSNIGEVPFSYDHFRRQQERWAAGSAQAFRTYFWRLLKTKHLSIFEKMSVIRQNAYFTTTLLASLSIILGFLTVSWIIVFWNSYSVECYLFLIEKIKVPLFFIIYVCLLSNFIEPLFMILFKTKDMKMLAHIPMTVWLAWSILPTYFIGNLKGLYSISLNWFRTPKYSRLVRKKFKGIPTPIRLLNRTVLLAVIIMYFSEACFLGWMDVFAILLLPAFLLASIK